MISTNTIYNNLVSNGAKFEWQVLNNNATIGKGNIVDGSKIESSTYERISVGNCIASQLHLTLWNATIDTSYPLEVQFRAVAPDDGTGSSPATSSWYTKGIFYVDTMERSLYSENIEVAAFDSMLKTETDFMPTGSYVPMTALAAAQTIATDIGVSLESNTTTILTNNPYTLSNAPNVGVGGTTDREMLSYIGTIYGGNWVITADNKLKLILAYESPSNTVNIGNAVSNFMASEVETVKRVKLWLDSETYYLAPTGYSEDDWLALGGRCLEIKLPFYATQALATSIYNNFSNKSYYPYKAQTAYVDPKYEVGDGITIVTATPVTSVIASQTITVDALASSELEFKSEEKLDSLYPRISSVERTTFYEIGQAKEAAEAAASSVGNANYREQLIYISKASGTTSVSANTTWVTNDTGNQNTWTTKRPVYSSSYPVLFVATQRQSVEQSSGTSCSCTTPVVDQTTTVIDGGHITTGTIDAGVVNVTNLNANNIVTGTISDSSGKNYWNLNSGQFVTKQGTIGGFTIGETALTTGSMGVGQTGSQLDASGITYTSYNSGNAKTYNNNFKGGGITFNGAKSGASGFTHVGSIIPIIQDNGYGTLEIDVQSGQPNIRLYDSRDTSTPYPNQLLYKTVAWQGLVVGTNGSDEASATITNGNVYAGQLTTAAEHYCEARSTGGRIEISSKSDGRGIWIDGGGWVMFTQVGSNTPTWTGNLSGNASTASNLGFTGTVGASTNLNNITTLGKYYEPSSGSSYMPSNVPPGMTEAFVLYVVSANGSGSISGNWAYGQQILKTISGDRVYMRPMSTNGSGTLSFGDWTLIAGVTKSLWSGTLTNSALTIANGYLYNQYIIYGLPSGGSASTVVIPKSVVGTSDTQFELADNAGYRTFKIRHSGYDLIITGVGAYNGGVINSVHGAV